MAKDQDTDRVVTVMRNCVKQLRRAHGDLSAIAAPVDPLTKIDGVANALEGLAGTVEETLNRAAHAVRTAAGLEAQVDKLRNENAALSSRGIQRI